MQLHELRNRVFNFINIQYCWFIGENIFVENLTPKTVFYRDLSICRDTKYCMGYEHFYYKYIKGATK